MVKRSRFSHFAPLIALIWGGAVLLPLTAVCTEVPLKQAVIQSLQKTVELKLQDQAPRLARVQDTLSPGEALSTARAALAELRFDDGSLARVGGQALVRFVSTTRTLQLSNGTLLLLVPAARGQTRIQTPNAVVSMRGSALFVRYVPETNMTLIGALTSGIEIANGDRSQTQILGAGQLAVVTHNRLEPAYRFDLKTFYETSALVKGLDLQHLLAGQRSSPTDGAIEAVRAETAEAVQQQAPFCADGSTGNGAPLEGNQTAPSVPRSTKPAIANAANCRTVGATPIPTSGQSDAALAQPTPIDPSTTTLLAPTVTQPATLPPTLALPTNVPLVNPPAAIAPPTPPPTLPNTPLPGERPPFPNPNRPNPNFLNPNLPIPDGNNANTVP